MRKRNIKILIVVLIVIILVGAIIWANTRKKYKLEEYVKTRYDYFAMYSVDDKVGVIDKKGNLILEADYSDVFIPNPTKDVFFAYENSTDYKILNSNGKILFSNYENVEALQTSELSIDFEKVFLKFQKDGKYGLIDFSRKSNCSSRI